MLMERQRRNSAAYSSFDRIKVHSLFAYNRVKMHVQEWNTTKVVYDDFCLPLCSKGV